MPRERVREGGGGGGRSIYNLGAQEIEIRC